MIPRIVTLMLLTTATATAEALDHVRVSGDGTHFVRGDAAEQFVVWGVNYDNDRDGRLLDEYWVDEWQTVVEDFREIKALGANCVRIHLQLGKFLGTPDTANATALEQFKKLGQLGGVAQGHFKNPAFAVRILVDPLRRAEQLAVRRGYGAGYRAVEWKGGFEGLNNP